MRHQTRDDHVIWEPDRSGKHTHKTEPHQRSPKQDIGSEFAETGTCSSDNPPHQRVRHSVPDDGQHNDQPCHGRVDVQNIGVVVEQV